MVEARDAWTAEAIDALFPGWCLTLDAEGGADAPAIALATGTSPG